MTQDTHIAEPLRQMVELTLSAGRPRQSSQTGFVHHFYQKIEEEALTIPVLENTIFALALFRTRMSDNIQEAKSLLDKLLYFQNLIENDDNGNFPVYIHEYPHCKDRMMSIRVLVPLYWIWQGFHHILGESLKNRLKETVLRLISYSLKITKERNIPYPFLLQIGGLARAFGQLFTLPNFVEQGQAIIDSQEAEPNLSFWLSPDGLSEVISAVQISDPSFRSEHGKKLWSHLANTWDSVSCAYVGPGWKEYQSSTEPTPCLYDLFMSIVSGAYSYRAFVDHPYQLRAALIQPVPIKLPVPEQVLDGVVDGHQWKVVRGECVSTAAITKTGELNPSTANAFHLLKMIWGDKNHTQSLVCQGGNIESSTFRVEPDFVQMEFSLGNASENDDKEKSRDIIFFLDAEKEIKVKVNDILATTFKLEDDIKIFIDGMLFNVRFELINGDGRFMGHIMKGNRPSQTDLYGPNRFQAYDLQCIIRSVHRTDKCRIRATIRAQRES